MQIIIPRSNFLEELFPELINYTKLTDEDIAVIKEAYTFGEHQSEINIHDDFIEITIQEDVLPKKKNDFDELIKLCEAKKYDNALSLADKLIEQQPAVSEYHRIKGQVLAEQDQPDEAIDALIEAVRLDPENSAALIMLGNIYARTYSDAKTAITFYERVLETNPENYFAVNNIGGNLANLGKYEEAKRYFNLALEINSNYPNALYGLALTASKQGDTNQSFELARQTFFKLNKDKHSELFNQNLMLAKQESRKSLRGGGITGISSTL